MPLLLDILHEDTHCLDDLNVDGTMVELQKARKIPLQDIFLNKHLEVVGVAELLTVD